MRSGLWKKLFTTNKDSKWDMQQITGRYATAIVYTDIIEEIVK